MNISDSYLYEKFLMIGLDCLKCYSYNYDNPKGIGKLKSSPIKVGLNTMKLYSGLEERKYIDKLLEICKSCNFNEPLIHNHIGSLLLENES